MARTNNSKRAVLAFLSLGVAARTRRMSKLMMSVYEAVFRTGSRGGTQPHVEVAR